MINFAIYSNVIFLIYTTIFCYFLYRAHKDLSLVFVIFLICSELISFKYSIIDEIIFILLILYGFKFWREILNSLINLKTHYKLFLLVFLLYINFNIFFQIYHGQSLKLLVFSFFYSSLVFLFLLNRALILTKDCKTYSELAIKKIAYYIFSVMAFVLFIKYVGHYYYLSDINLLQGNTWPGSARLLTLISLLLLILGKIFLNNKNNYNFISLCLGICFSGFFGRYLDSQSIVIIFFLFTTIYFLIISGFIKKIIILLCLWPGYFMPLIITDVDSYIKAKSNNLSKIILSSGIKFPDRKHEMLGVKIKYSFILEKCGDIKDIDKLTNCIISLYRTKSASNFTMIVHNLSDISNVNFWSKEKDSNNPSSHLGRRTHYLALYDYLKSTSLLQISLGNGFYSHKLSMTKYFQSAYEIMKPNQYNFEMYKGSRLDGKDSEIFRTNSLISLIYDIGIFGIIGLIILLFPSYNQLYKSKNYLALITFSIWLSLGLIINITSAGFIFGLILMPNIFINKF